jgi:hypothetical protein
MRVITHDRARRGDPMIGTSTASGPDVILVGAGIMSATLGVLLKELEPALNISMVETLDGAALESSDAWNNAGTGHAANCELNYTPERSDGSIDISKALDVNVEFDLSRQLWSYLVTKGAIADPQSFIHPVPHMSFVRGPENVAFLKKRFAAMIAHHCYYGMEYTEDKKKLSEWVPLVMEGRAAKEQVAATRIITGADVDYGSLTRSLVRYLAAMKGLTVHYGHRVTGISREPGGRWRVDTKSHHGGEKRSTTAKFVYLGAGGGALPLLQKSGIPEGKGYGGFPVSGPGRHRAPPCQSLRQSICRFSTDVGSSSRHAGHWWQALDLVWPLRGLLHQVPQARLAHGPVRVDPVGEYRIVAGGCTRQFRSDQISDRTGSADRPSPLCCPAGILSARQAN